MRGRPRKPTAELEAKGAFRKDPQRRAARQHEPKSNGAIGDPPAYFDDAHRAVWFEFIDECPKGVLTQSDRKHLELATRLQVKARMVPCGIPRWLRFLGDALLDLGLEEEEVQRAKDAIHAAMGISAQELSLLATTLTRMGMTPADRSRVHVEPDKPEADPFDQVVAILGRPASAKSVQ